MRISYSAMAGAAVFVGAALFLLFKIIFPEVPTFTTATVDTGRVRELVSVSGFVEAKQAADLSFPSNGTVTAVLVEEGASVKAGEVLATLASAELVAERAAAVSARTAAEASYNKLIAGPRNEAVSLANTTLASAKENLSRATEEENRKIENARAALRSTGLEAKTTDFDENSPAPTISGTYRCNEEGSYTIEVYRSGSASGMSYKTSGLETTSGIVSTDQPAPLGSCGLFLLFPANESYNNSTWVIEVPNTASASYTSLKNTYELVQTQAKNTIAAAKDAVTIAEKETSLTTASARSEEVQEALARINEAAARVTAIDARLADRSIVAPFAGIVTSVDIVTGENTPAGSVLTVLATDAFTLKARIPEIDITKLAIGQKVEAVFDAVTSELETGTITYIAPIASQIDGVAYFETTIALDSTPAWLRAGLNADIDIITKEKISVTRVPKRFIIKDTTAEVVLVQTESGISTTTIQTVFVGNDGFIEISGVNPGTVVIAP